MSLLPIGSFANEHPNFQVAITDPLGRYIDQTFTELSRGTAQARTVSLQQHMLARVRVRSGEHSPEESLETRFAFDTASRLERTEDWKRCYIAGDRAFTMLYDASEAMIEVDGLTFRARRLTVESGGAVIEGTISDRDISHGRMLVHLRYDVDGVPADTRIGIVAFENLGLVEIERTNDDGETVPMKAQGKAP